MPFLVQPDRCPCCRAMVWHCLDCWNKYHHGGWINGKSDFIPPKYPNQPLFEMTEEMKEEWRKINEKVHKM